MTFATALQNDGPALAGQAPVAAPSVGAVPGAPPAAAPAAPAGDMFWILIPVLVMMVLFSTLSGRKQKKARAKMLSELRKNDRVVTAGGIIGSVVEVKPDVVVLRVDEGRETKLTFTRDAITNILKRDSSESDDATTAKLN
ncbi:MAG: preprotein translocase subunit YajC [Planctomycetes bacterium]|nr:preprotein translocase subunit YajC [Planctomycetota bacterium]